MRIPEQLTQVRRMLHSRLRQLGSDQPILAASLAQVHKTCGQPSCACHKGGAKHQAHHLTVKEDGKTRTIYVPVDLVDDVRTWVEEHKRLKALLAEISQLTLALVKGHVQQRR